MIHSTALRPALSAFSLALLGACSSERTLTTPTAAPPTDSLAAKFPPLVGQIAFTSTRDGSTYIYVAAADGSSLRRLAAGASPAWSWDGRQIAFNGWTTRRAHRRSMSSTRMAPGNACFRSTVPGPRGRPTADSSRTARIAVSTWRTSTVRILDSCSAAISHHRARPWAVKRGRPTAHASRSSAGTGTATPFQLYVVNVDGSDIRPLTPYDPKRGVPQVRSASWSPDGSMVACEEDFGATAALGIANADGSFGQTATTSIPVSTHPIGRRTVESCRSPARPLPETRIFATDPVLHTTIQLIPNAISTARRPYDDFDAVWSRTVQP